MRLINRHPDRGGRLLLILLPFALLLFAYFTGSAARLTDNPNDKLLPSASQMVSAIDRLAFTEDKRSGEYLFWQDSAASLSRLGMGIGYRGPGGAMPGYRCRHPAALPCAAVAAAHRAVDGATAGDTADPVYRLWPGRTVQGDADRHRHHPGAGP